MRKTLTDYLTAIGLILSLILTVACLPPPGKNIHIETSDGTVVGKSDDGVKMFLGVSYAKPPVGDLRWKAPQPHPRWNLREAFYQPKGCIQSTISDVFQSSEDCLYLNIWAPDSPGPHPVMVWIHGGGLDIGSVPRELNDGRLAQEKNVVLVAINYRLGPLGYLLLSEDDQKAGDAITGNQGFHDQIFALQWLQKNIAAFGGDPGNVTVFGESAGAASACLLLASPLTDNLLHKVIIQSSACDSMKPLTLDEAEQQGRKFLEDIGCSTQADPVACARSTSPSSLYKPLGYEFGSIFHHDIITKTYVPRPALGTSFLPEHPDLLLASSQKSADVSAIIGVVKNEGTIMIGQEYHPDNHEGYVDLLEQYYYDEAENIADLYPLYEASSGVQHAQILTDQIFLCRSVRFADIWSQTHDVFFYHFTQPVYAPVMNAIMQIQFGENALGAAPLGTFHGSDIPYTWGVEGILGRFINAEQRQTKRAMMSYWTNFAYNSNPNDTDSSLPKWSKYSNLQQNHIVLNANDGFPEVDGLRKAYCDYWLSHEWEY